MIINFLGDSITEGFCASEEQYKYVNQVGKTLNCTVRNYGISGTRIAKNRNNEYPDDFQLRALRMEDDADYVFVFGGTNDFGHGDGPLGTPDSTDPYTFYGGLNTLISILKGKYAKEKIIFILPMRRAEENNPCGSRKPTPVATLSEYVDIMKEVLDGENIAYIDMFNNSVLLTPPVGESTYFKDGLHPNDVGHTVLAQLIVGYVQRMEFEKIKR